MDMDIFTPEGLPAQPGERGELVCKKPFPNMPVMFLNDTEDKKRYHAAYFEGFEGVWTHGDFVRMNPETKGTFVLGRSDGVLNPNGVRSGFAEIYTVLEAPGLKELIGDALVVGLQRADGKFQDDTERVLLVVKSVAGHASRKPRPDVRLVEKIKEHNARDLSRRHVPHFVFEMDEIPYNVNGKKLEILAKKVINGGPDVVAKLKMTDDEARTMRKYEQFDDINQVVRQESELKAKL
ncbi:putative ANL domain, AMP-binding enzyme domain superfamily [Septoria linicola]|nr:putative ANL domain, AMP-binding enzyme domain superfamily [Septoria linicola]